ncbi:WhiB family transcriptional regulator [Mycolicibacterium fortuitum]|uniref:WhiB family transcriptional regulator n=2 Tax=Mycolicibacterium fortuitum TaxID=1766 RepID=UPI000941EAE4|nr:WhiB family transcriptional regulator [Mycolicibacterium fortuitum]
MTDYWQGRAACADHRPSRWDTDEPDPQVLQICGECPVKEQCLQDALDRNETHGIRGGYTPNQRAAIKQGHALPPAGPRTCRNCNTAFTPPHHRTYFCTERCRDESRRTKQRTYEATHRERRRERDAARPGSRHTTRRKAAA